MRDQVDFLAKEESHKKEARKANRPNAIAIYKAGTPHPWKEDGAKRRKRKPGANIGLSRLNEEASFAKS
jgi:hypothetical protein